MSPRTALHLLGFISNGSPLRSPHVAKPTFLGSYFSSMSNPIPPASSRHSNFALQPSRRDIILCLLTLSFSYLLFSPPPTSEPLGLRNRSQASSGGYRIPGWSKIFTTELGCPPVPSSGETTFGESVKMIGPQVAMGVEGDEFRRTSNGRPWEEGEEEAEDDELGSVFTVLAGHQPGWTMMERLYVFNGSFYVVTDERADWPELRMMTSTGLPAYDEPGNSEAREPKGNEIIFIKPYEAVQLWGQRVYKMEGTTWLFNDGQFIDHYYHFAAELLLGSWRTYASLDRAVTPLGETVLPPPRRIWFLHQSVTQWSVSPNLISLHQLMNHRRDEPRFNPTVMFAIFPSISLLYPEDFADLANITSSALPKAYMLERALLADRSAAFRGPWTAPTSRTVANALRVGETSRWWWEPIRRQVLRYSGVPDEVINRNLEGTGAMDPAILRQPYIVGPGIAEFDPLVPAGDYAPVITYISRQLSRRRLTADSHDGLVKALEEKSTKLGWELVIVEAEKMTKEEQFALAGRTTIMLGVHGNGLSHLLWMPATPRSAVIEMFFPGGFARDYQWTAHALGIRHFAIQHDLSFTSPNLPIVAYPEGFQGTAVTVVGNLVADIIEDRLAGKI